ncbi:MAG: mannose-6-phosphate isomerase, class I [Deltaproteobacteria bacterium]|nr:mannose-6-phosphate isomerase, class I [Deltaproteobacteria bacterium]
MNSFNAAQITDLTLPLKLLPTVQHFAWGMHGECYVKRLAGSSAGPAPFAELWIGSHPASPSQVVFDASTVPLNQVISLFPGAVLGASALSRFDAELPFLFKVLSVAEPLSIQAHPNAELASRLHFRDPKHYPDKHHKPELSVALSEFELLCGIRPVSEINTAVAAVPELAALIGPLSGQSIRQDQICEIFDSVLNSPQGKIQEESKTLYKRLKSKAQLSAEESWILRLERTYPNGDPGLFCFFLMNLMKLAPQQAIYLAPHTPHAYLRGELLECMASSDNVVRAGLTPKFRDVETLLEMIRSGGHKPILVEPEISQHNGVWIRNYPTPALEFALCEYQGSSNQIVLNGRDLVQMIFMLEGTGDLSSGSFSATLSEGDAYLLPAAAPSCHLKLDDARLISVLPHHI